MTRHNVTRHNVTRLRDQHGRSDTPWRRLNARVVWIDLVLSAISVCPGIVVMVFTDVQPSLSTMWPVILVAVLGVGGAVADLLRWSFTRYRVNGTEVERQSGVIVRRSRSVQLDRIRSVDTYARLRHRIAGLRVVTIGAGQQAGTGESALLLDALSKKEAAVLRDELLDRSRVSEEPVEQRADPGAPELLAMVRPWWVVFNLFSIWAYLMAAALLWGGFWLATSLGLDVTAIVGGLADWDALGWPGITAVALVLGGLVGAIGLGINFLISQWRFRLERVRSGDQVYLRTRRGLLSTHEVSRDEARRRGITISEPVFWRWMGMADTNVITTGLSVWSMQEPTAILPRGPVQVAREVAAKVLGEPSPMAAPLKRHPRAALLRRCWWALAVGLVPIMVMAGPVATGGLPALALLLAVGIWVIALPAAVVAYRALGHAVVGSHLVVRSGLLSRATTALRCDAVSTFAIRQSILQRRLGLCTVSVMTAAGWGVYEAPDIGTTEAPVFASQAAPELVRPMFGAVPTQ